jgi:hypothetical protein
MADMSISSTGRGTRLTEDELAPRRFASHDEPVARGAPANRLDDTLRDTDENREGVQ